MTIAELTRQAGHCSQCGKIWTLETRQGVCQWCGKTAICQSSTTPPRHSKSSRSQKPKQPNGIGKDYDQLPDPYLTYFNVALPFAKSVPTQDWGDLLHTIILTLARANGHKPLTEPALYRIASRTKADYWRAHYKHTNGLDCGHCSNRQRQKCHRDWLFTQCPKATKIESLNKPIIDSEGNLTELGDLIADDKALDIPQWLERNEQLLHCPDRILAIAGKIQDGEALTHYERTVLSRFRKAEQKNLF